MSEREEIWHLPGDNLEFDLGLFEHEQHIVSVSLIYRDATDENARIELTGEPVEATQPRRESPERVIYTSKVTVKGRIPKSRQGSRRYWLTEIAARTYDDNTLQFDQPPDVWAERNIPRTVCVQREPSTSPRFV